MTYGLGLLCEEGLAFFSDSRTSAGVDNITIHPKMRIFSRAGDRVLCMLSSGNLSITQSVVALIDRDCAKRDAGEPVRSLMHCDDLHDTVRYLGEKIREVHKLDGEAMEQGGVAFSANFILGGQIAGQPPELYLVYSQGNAIHASRESPFLQIGEVKYGKPILDRGFTYDTPLNEAVKFGLLSLDSTAKSNVSVGTPFDVFCYKRDSLEVKDRISLDDHHPYLRAVQDQWHAGLIQLVHSIPALEFSK